MVAVAHGCQAGFGVTVAVVRAAAVPAVYSGGELLCARGVYHIECNFPKNIVVLVAAVSSPGSGLRRRSARV